MLVCAGILTLVFSLPYITASEAASQQTISEWPGNATLLFLLIALIGGLFSFLFSLPVRFRYMWNSLIASGAVYIACCLPVSIYEFLHLTVPLYKAIVAVFFLILPGLACLLEGAFFISRSGKTRQNLADKSAI